MEIFYKPFVEKQLKRIPNPQVKKIARKLIYLKNQPYAGKPLKGEFRGEYSLKVWPYRIIYEIKKTRIVVLSILHRQGVYK